MLATATPSALRAVGCALTALGAVTVSSVPGGAARAADGDPGRSVIVQPTRVAPGQDFAVFDGGSCAAKTGTASFVPPPDGERFPDLALGPVRDMVGGTGVVPKDAAPGYYRVNVVCGEDRPFSASFTVTGGAFHPAGVEGDEIPERQAPLPPGAPPHAAGADSGGQSAAGRDGWGGVRLGAWWAAGGGGVLAVVGGALGYRRRTRASRAR
ncbi:hypothetical protein JJV70_18810 [Streptomyces sp. JJ66]|uniref:hypothetical protein n=1 Tax=Streptomyces sp. JJ66 TaxID=2803843 RepID=UPI001C598AE7|nr:hypothetical protein [Streptomyces sp. JJ66]MBW1604121.1 hypothetical protein [Streptomyces sp. JJ66]